MTSKEIIVRLVDEHLITGEEVYVLLNDIFKGEMVAVNETLNEAKRSISISPWVDNVSTTGYTSITSSK